MPTVPTYNSSQVQTQRLAAPKVNTQVPLEAFGGGQVADRIESSNRELLNSSLKLLKQEKDKADDARSQEAWSTYLNEKNDQLWNPEYGAYNKKQKDAFGLADQYMPKMNEKAQEILDSLDNEDQRQMVQKMIRKIDTDFQSELDRHTFKETQKYEQSVMANGLEASQEDAILNYQNPGVIQESIGTQKTLIEDYAQKNGWSKEELDNKLSEATSQTHSKIINRMVNIGDDRMAKAYFNEVKDTLSGDDIASIEKIVQEGSYRGESQRIVDDLMGQGLSQTQALEKIKDIEDPRLRDEASQRLRNETAAIKAAKQADQEKTFTEVSNVVESTGSRETIDMATWLNLSDAQRKSIDSRISQLRKGIEPETNWDTYYDLKTMASNASTRNAFLKKDLRLERPNMANAEFKELINLQTALRKGKDSDKLLNGYRSNHQIVNDTLKEIDINPSPKAGTDEATRVNQFRRMVDDQVMLYQQQSGKKATTSDVQGIVDRLTTQVITDRGWIWDTEALFFEAPPANPVDLELDQVPAGERAKIESALRKNNLPINEQNILNLYTRKLETMRNASQ